MKVRWTETAMGHLQDIYDHIARDSPTYAKRMVDRLTARSKQIGAAPWLGGMVIEYGRHDVREVLEKPYRIIYRVHEQQVDVLAVIHAARLLPPEV